MRHAHLDIEQEFDHVAVFHLVVAAFLAEEAGVAAGGFASQAHEVLVGDDLAELCAGIMSRHDIRDIVGHSDIAPGRKRDPGPLFPWEWMTIFDRQIKN